MHFDCIERRLSRAYDAYARVVARCPAPFIIIPICLTAALSAGCLWRLNFLEDKIELYIPTDGPATYEMDIINNLFPVQEDDPNYALRTVDAGRSGLIYVSGSNLTDILQFDVFDEIALLWRRMQQIVVSDGNKWVSYEDLCITTPAFASLLGSNSSCVQNPLLAVYSKTPVILRSLPRNPLFLRSLGGAQSKDGKDLIIGSAKVIALPYILRHTNPRDDRLAQAWENKLNSFLASYTSDRLQLNWWTSTILQIETESERIAIRRMIGPLIAVVSLFTLLCCLSSDCSRSKPELGLGGVFCAGAAIVSAVGFMGYAGQHFTSVVYFMPFIVFSISVDNVFILTAAWQKTDRKSPVADRLAGVFRDAGVSITVTSLTDGLSFGIGSHISFLSVKMFCLYAAVAMVFVFVYQMSMFAAIMAYSGRREESGTCCCFAKAKPELRGTESSSPKPEPPEPKPTIEEIIPRFFRDTYSRFILLPVAQGAIVALFTLYILSSIFGCTLLKTGLLPTDLLPGRSQAFDALLLQDRFYAHDSGQLNVMFTSLDTDLDYVRPHFWAALEHALTEFEDTKFTKTGDFWLRTFLVYSRANGVELTEDNFILELADFLEQEEYRRYKLDVKINAIYTRLLYSRTPVQLHDVTLATQPEAIAYFRHLAGKSFLNCSVYSPFFRFADQHGMLVSNMLVNLGLASTAVILVSLVLIPKPVCSIWVCLTIASITVGVVGHMAFWGVKLDFISMVTIVMSIGFSVDFSAHMAYHFAIGKEEGKSKKIRAALYAVGTPILQSGISTLLGMTVLVSIDSYIYKSFVKIIVLVVVFGVFHGLLVLPVLLTFFHCRPRAKAQTVQPAKVAPKTQPHVETITPRATPVPYSNGAMYEHYGSATMREPYYHMPDYAMPGMPDDSRYHTVSHYHGPINRGLSLL